MKRLSSSDSLGALMSVCPTTEEHSPSSNHVYGRDFRSMLDGLDEEGCVEESGHVSEKKRRLSVDQVKALEKNFEVENKLEPERKVKLAQELGLQPRQVAVWFQNRRARWKTKQLERDYGHLKASYDSLKLNYDALKHDNEALLKEIRELKSKLQDEKSESNLRVKEELIIGPTESDNKLTLNDPNKQAPQPHHLPPSEEESKELNYESLNDTNNGVVLEVSMFPDFKDGASDSDSSAILNEDVNNNNNNSTSPSNTNGAMSSTGVLTNHQLMMSSSSPASTSLNFNYSSSSSPSSSSLNCFQFHKATASFQPPFVKIEEHNFFAEEACNFFSDDQAPTLQWYCSDQWN